jgi:hypothetical protein
MNVTCWISGGATIYQSEPSAKKMIPYENFAKGPSFSGVARVKNSVSPLKEQSHR